MTSFPPFPLSHFSASDINPSFSTILSLIKRNRAREARKTFKIRTDLDSTGPVSNPVRRVSTQLLPHALVPEEPDSNAQWEEVAELLKQIEFFKKLSLHVCIEIGKVAGYQKVRRGDVIFYQGSIATAFYVIVTGCVSVSINDVTSGDELGYEVSVLGPGKSFGELALISEASTRNATVKALEETEILVIEKVDFEKILKISYDLEQQEKISFLQKVPVFSDCTMRELIKISVAMNHAIFEPKTCMHTRKSFL